MDRTVVMLAVAEYLCRHGSVGIFRLVDDVVKRSEVKQALKLASPPAPGSNEWWRAYHAVLDAVRALEREGLVKYLHSVGVVNWVVRRCL